MNAQSLLRFSLFSAALVFGAANLIAEDTAARDALRQKLEPYFHPPGEFAGQLGPYRSPLQFADGSIAKTPEDWARRRKEIPANWHQRLGPWPALIERPAVKTLETVNCDGY